MSFSSHPNTPLPICTLVMSCLQTHPQPTYADSVRIDDGLAVLAQPGRGCVKLWICFPPTQHNLDVFTRSTSELDRLMCCIPHLQNGFYVILRPGSSLFLPAGWLHSVYTLAGGWQFATSFTTRHSLTGTSRWLRTDKARLESLTPDEHNKIAENFIDTLLHELEFDDGVENALQEWCMTYPHVMELISPKSRASRVVCAPIEAFLRHPTWKRMRQAGELPVELETRIRGCINLLKSTPKRRIKKR